MKFNSNRKRYSIFTLAAVFFVAVFAAIGLLVSDYLADARTVTLSGSNYFYTSNTAAVDAYCADASEETYYQSFVFNSDDDYVTYRKNLAYNWYTAADAEGYFSLEIGFADLTFDTFTIKFQSQQYTLTEDGVTTNYLTFVKGTTGVYAITTTEEPDDDDIAEAESKSHEYSKTDITISFKAYKNGVYYLEITDGTTTSKAYDSTDTSDETYIYQLENIGSTYAKYVSSSSSTSVIPLTFSATGIDDGSEAEMILYNLNGQEFELSDIEWNDEDANNITYLEGNVTDTTAPVLCIDGDFTSVRYGYDLELSYAVIDVLATSPRTTIYYDVLTNAQYNNTSLDLELSTSQTSNDNYTEVSTTDTYAFIDPVDVWTGFTDTADSGYTTKCVVKIVLKIQDSTASGGNSDYVYLDWYVDSDYLVEVNGNNFIRAVKDSEGVTYNYQPIYTEDDGNGGVTTVSYGNAEDYDYTLEELQEAYQAAVDDEKTKQAITAGDDNYFYLPSFEGYLTDNLSGYKDLTYSIYVISGTSSSVSSDTGLDYNELSITLSNEGKYRFVIFATDNESNDMYYLRYDSDTSEWEKVTFTSSDISDMLTDAVSELWNYVPWFTFEVSYEGLVVEDAGAQSIAYVDTTYSASDFDITGLNSGYTTSYKLYEFDISGYYSYIKALNANSQSEEEPTISYSEMLDQIINLFEGIDDSNTSEYFREIVAYDDLEETDPYYDDFCDYEWDPDSLSFVPQEKNTFYVIRLEVTDTNYITDTVKSYMVISSSAVAEELTGESRWLQDNLASVILLAVAAAALIGILLLIFIKPKDKGDIDLIDLGENERKTRKKIAKGSKSDNE